MTRLEAPRSSFPLATAPVAAANATKHVDGRLTIFAEPHPQHVVGARHSQADVRWYFGLEFVSDLVRREARQREADCMLTGSRGGGVRDPTYAAIYSMSSVLKSATTGRMKRDITPRRVPIFSS